MKGKSENKDKVKLSDDIVKDITFFETDLNEMSRQLNSAESLYNDLFSVYTNFTGGKYVSMKSPRDIAEIAKALVAMRSLCSDTAFKRHQIRKNLSDIVHKSDPHGEYVEEDLIKETARTILNEVRGYMDDTVVLNKRRKGNDSFSDLEKEELNLKVDNFIRNGDIKLSKNDKLIGVSDFVEYQYDNKDKEFVAIDARSGAIIKDFPKERLPKSSISLMVDKKVITDSGDSFKILGE
jgi:hypothetical protein